VVLGQHGNIFWLFDDFSRTNLGWVGDVTASSGVGYVLYSEFKKDPELISKYFNKGLDI